jgi:integrase/recombinase XerD
MESFSEEAELQKKPSIVNCPRCNLVNAIDNKYCSKCSYPLIPSAFDEIKEAENMKMKEMEQRYESSMKAMREEMERKFQELFIKIDVQKLS